VWGNCDRLVPAAFARHVAACLPAARQEVLGDCGHVPQVELAERTNRLIRDRIASVVRPARARQARRSRLAGALARSVAL
jgi:hypothetical protein